MSVPRDPIAAASKVRGEIAAARLVFELEAELVTGDPAPEWETAAEQALDDLGGRFGGLDRLRELQIDRPPGTSESRKPPKRSGPTGSTKPTSSTPTSSTSPAKDGERSSTSPAGRGRARSGSSRKPARSKGARAARSFGGRVVSVTGAGDAGTLAMTMLAGTVGMVLLYVLIRGKTPGAAGAGADAISWAARAFTNGLQAFMAPTDPLQGTAATKAAHLQQTAADAVAGSDGPGTAGDVNGGGGEFAPSVVNGTPVGGASTRFRQPTMPNGKQLPL